MPFLSLINTVSINRRLSCLSLQPVCEEHRKKSLQREKHRSKKVCEQFSCIFFPRSIQIYCVFTKINTTDSLEWSVESEVCDEDSVIGRLCPLSHSAPSGLKLSWHLQTCWFPLLRRFHVRQIRSSRLCTQFKHVPQPAPWNDPVGWLVSSSHMTSSRFWITFIFISRCNICFLLF